MPERYVVPAVGKLFLLLQKGQPGKEFFIDENFLFFNSLGYAGQQFFNSAEVCADGVFFFFGFGNLAFKDFNPRRFFDYLAFEQIGVHFYKVSVDVAVVVEIFLRIFGQQSLEAGNCNLKGLDFVFDAADVGNDFRLVEFYQILSGFDIFSLLYVYFFYFAVGEGLNGLDVGGRHKFSGGCCNDVDFTDYGP